MNPDTPSRWEERHPNHPEQERETTAGTAGEQETGQETADHRKKPPQKAVAGEPAKADGAQDCGQFKIMRFRAF